MQEYNFVVSDGDYALRLDAYLAQKLLTGEAGFSRAFIQRLIRQGNVVVDGNIVKSHHKIKQGETIKIIVPLQTDIKPNPENIPLDVIYEDEDVIVINKPRGLVVHPAPGNLSGTLVNALLFHCKDLSTVNPQRPGIVHRLDKDTAGLMVAAKNNAAYLALTKQFAQHSIRRVYLALVLGEVEFDEGVIDLPLSRDAFRREKIAVSFKEEAREALTRYKVIKRYKSFTHLELCPQTGRTHQLRVHMAALGHPILGDEAYGRKDEKIKLALYAGILGFTHPRTGKYVEFKHDLPQDMQKILDSAG